jgi:transcription elongation factor Elf1
LIVKHVKLNKPTIMAKCGNCGKALSCGCQKRKASNGAAVCSTCISSYENTQVNKTIKPLELDLEKEVNKLTTPPSWKKVYKSRQIK